MYSQPALELVYSDVEKLIHNVVWNHVRAFGGNHGELLSVAAEAFIKVAIPTYDKHQGTSFPWWVEYKVGKCLLTHARRTNTVPARLGIAGLYDRRFDFGIDKHYDLTGYARKEGGFDIADFYSKVSAPSVFVVNMVLNGPLHYVHRIRHQKSRQRVVRKHLKRLGWTGDQIAKTFQEIREALR